MSVSDLLNMNQMYYIYYRGIEIDVVHWQMRAQIVRRHTVAVQVPNSFILHVMISARTSKIA